LASISDAICGRGKLIDSDADIDENWFAETENIEQVGISAGASTPDFLVEAVIEKLVQLSDGHAELELPVKKRKINKIPRT
jgi:4-hydroxy-3-methylbut-2-enyl diphosphate reductase